MFLRIFTGVSQVPCPETDQPNFPSPYLKIYFSIIHPSMTRSFKYSHSLRFFYQKPASTSSFPVHATCPVHLVTVSTTRIVFLHKYKLFNSLFSLSFSVPVHRFWGKISHLDTTSFVLSFLIYFSQNAITLNCMRGCNYGL